MKVLFWKLYYLTVSNNRYLTRAGFVLQADGMTCLEVDVSNPCENTECSDICAINAEGNAFCACFDGRYLENNFQCIDETDACANSGCQQLCVLDHETETQVVSQSASPPQRYPKIPPSANWHSENHWTVGTQNGYKCGCESGFTLNDDAQCIKMALTPQVGNLAPFDMFPPVKIIYNYLGLVSAKQRNQAHLDKLYAR